MWQRLSGFAVLLMIAVGVVSAPATRACACSCARQLTPDEAQARAAVVFDGVALTVDGGPNDGTGGPVTVRFAVDEVRKGPQTDRMLVSTPTNSAACGFDFQPGQRYRVYATADGKTGLCSGNLPLGPAPAQPRGGTPTVPGGDTGASGEPATGASPGRQQDASETPGGSEAATRAAPVSSTGETATVLVVAVLVGTALLGGGLLGWWTRRRRSRTSA